VLGAVRLEEWFAVPIEAEPAEVLDAGVVELGPDARGVEIFKSQQDLAALGAGAPIRQEEGAGVPDMEQARGARGES
jgi:hypothetical protein